MRSGIICFKCGKQGRRQSSCLNSNEKGPQKTAAVQMINENSYHDDQLMYSDRRPHNCDESLGDGEVKLAYGFMLSVVAGAFGREGERNLKKHLCQKYTLWCWKC